MNRRQRYWIILTAIGLAGGLLALVVIRAPRTVPLAECSEVYRQYRHQPGVRAAFIRQMPINDTLRLDMTLLEAEDSAAFADLLRAMGKSEEKIDEMMLMRRIYGKRENSHEIRFTGDCVRGAPGVPGGPDPNNNEIVSYFPVRMCVAVIHTHTEQEIELVFHKSLFNEINIDKH